MSRDALMIVIGLLVIAWSIWVAIDFKHGRSRSTGVPTYRDKDPSTFWFNVAFNMVIIASFAAAVIFMLHSRS